MERYKTKANRNQTSLSPLCFDDMIDEDNPVRAIDAIAESMEIPTLGFKYSETASTGRMLSKFQKAKKIIALLLAAATTLGLFGCSASHNTIQTVKMNASMSTYYESLSHLKKDASEIIECKVLGNKAIVYEGVPFTISNVKVLSVIKGSVKAGDTIQVIETGGIYNPSGDSSGQLVNYELEGNPVMKVNEDLYVFLQKFEGPQIEGAYIPVGEFMGKFSIDWAGKVKQLATDEYKIKNLGTVSKNKFLDSLK